MPGEAKRTRQVERFHEQVVELIKKYQFRDRSETACCGISVSQCYVLESLHRCGPLTMGELAGRMYLSVSTLTRVVEQLARKGAVSREADARDRRIRRIQLTTEGVALYRKLWRGVVRSESAIFESFPEEQREALIGVLQQLNRAVDGWRACCCR